MFYEARKFRLLIITLIFFAVSTLIISVGLGRYYIDIPTILRAFLSKVFPSQFQVKSEVETVLFNIRLPRVVFGMIMGAGLSCAGSSYQSIFQNPLVSPDVLGASAGAAFGAALGIYLGQGYALITAMSFTFGIAAVIIVTAIASKGKNNPVLSLVLAGMMVSTLCTSAISYLKLIADPMNQLPAITYWLMGSLASIRWSDGLVASSVIIAGIAGIVLLRWKINVISVGDDEASAMGVNVRTIRTSVVALATLITAACVSVCGLIGWVGLVIPHFARMLTGGDASRSIPVSALLGGIYLLLVDNFARLIATSEVPIGILTAFVGAPFFLFFIIREAKRD